MTFMMAGLPLRTHAQRGRRRSLFGAAAAPQEQHVRRRASTVTQKPPVPAPQRPVVQTRLVQRVLLLDDNSDALEMARLLLDADGHEVTCASDGVGGIAHLVEHKPDVAFVDIGLPNLNGYDMAARARTHGVTSYLIAMTGYGQPEDRKRALDAGFDLHLIKPVSVSDMRDALAMAAEAHRRHRASGSE